jgi:hypothetical protein
MRRVADDESFAELTAGWVRYEIARRGLRKKDVAAALDMKYSAFSSRYSGRLEWRLSELDRLAGVLGLTVGQLLHTEARGQSPAEAAPLDLRRLNLVVGRLAAEHALGTELIGQLRVEIDRLKG